MKRWMMNGLRALVPAAALVAAAMAAGAAQEQGQGQGQGQGSEQGVALLVRHLDVTNGADGVKRTTEFSERFYRRGGTVWIERVLPTASASAASHQAHEQPGDVHDHEHRHLNVATAARWITRGSDGNAELRLVSVQDAVVVGLTKVDWSNVGFDGSWAAASHLVDPAQLARMKTVRTDADTTTLVRDDAGGRLTVVWDRSAGVPIRVETIDARGVRKTTTERLPMPAVMPWSITATFDKKDYADYLD